MFVRIGDLAVRRARLILILAALAVVVFVAVGGHASSKLLSAGFTSSNAPSQQADDRLQANFGGGNNLTLLVEARSGTVDTPAVTAAGTALAHRLAAEADVSDVNSYWTTHAARLRSTDGRAALIVANIAGNDTSVQNRAKVIVRQLTIAANMPGPITVYAGGQTGVGAAVSTQITNDLKVAEGIAIPVTLLLLIVAFGSLIAALLPIAIGVVSIFATFFVLWSLEHVTSVSIYSVNLTTALGLGLGIDYSLLMVNRYREELRRGHNPQDAIRASVATAGRTIVFSAATVAAALAALAVFPVYFLRSFAYVGISVVAVSAIGALLVLPALMTVLGRQVNALALPWGHATEGRAESPFWGGVARRVMAHPVASGLPIIVLLLAAGIPFLHVHFGTPDDRVLPTSSGAHQVGNALRTQFKSYTGDSLDIATSSRVSDTAAANYSRSLSSLPGVVQVQGPAGVWEDGTLTIGAPTEGGAARNADWFSVSIRPDPLSSAAGQLVAEARALPAPPGTTAYVGGQAAQLVDQKHDIGSRLPLAIALIILTTFIVLFLFTGSIVLPIKALVLNALNLSAVLGAMVWIFQYGHLSGLLDFTPTATSTTVPPLLFSIAFGLSMDYEIFMLSRIKELHDAGANNSEAVAGGLARTGRIITTAAALLAVTFFAFGLSKVSFIQLFGIGTAIAILLDATIIRGVLVPAFMSLAGPANWWAPQPLRRLHNRIGLAENAEDAPAGAGRAPAA